jgi:CheY-like chemotaxis protein
MAILIVDDEPTIRDMVGELLDDEGYPTILAVDGADALVQLTARQEAPRLILLE